jgi:hypothetical protein
MLELVYTAETRPILDLWSLHHADDMLRLDAFSWELREDLRGGWFYIVDGGSRAVSVCYLGGGM